MNPREESIMEFRMVVAAQDYAFLYFTYLGIYRKAENFRDGVLLDSLVYVVEMQGVTAPIIATDIASLPYGIGSPEIPTKSFVVFPPCWFSQLTNILTYVQ
jgi:hypothetical protein